MLLQQKIQDNSQIPMGLLGGSMVKNLPAMQELQETWVPSLGWEDPLEEGMATHSSILAWRIPWREEPGRLQSIGSQTVTHDSSNLASRHASIYSTMYKHTHTHTHTHTITTHCIVYLVLLQYVYLHALVLKLDVLLDLSFCPHFSHDSIIFYSFP